MGEKLANGKTHEKINLSLLAVGLVSSLFLFNKGSFLDGFFIVLGYVIGTYFLGPDLDLKSRPFRRWRFLSFIWIPYQTFKHRSIWTHGIIISDILRYAYLASWLLLTITILGIFFNDSISTFSLYLKITFSEYKSLFFWLVIGNILSSTAHTLTDKTTSTIKRFSK